MSIIYFLVPAALCLGFLFLGIFIWTSQSGQYDDLETPAYRILTDEPITHINPQEKRDELETRS